MVQDHEFISGIRNNYQTTANLVKDYVPNDLMRTAILLGVDRLYNAASVVIGKNEALEDKCVALENKCNAFQMYSDKYKQLAKRDEVMANIYRAENEKLKSENEKLKETISYQPRTAALEEEIVRLRKRCMFAIHECDECRRVNRELSAELAKKEAIIQKATQALG